MGGLEEASWMKGLGGEPKLVGEYWDGEISAFCKMLRIGKVRGIRGSLEGKIVM